MAPSPPARSIAVDADSSACSATYSPTQYGFGSHHLGSSYPGSDDHAPSSNADSTAVVLMRTSATSISCDPLVIGVASTCTVSVTDTTGPADSGWAPYDAVNVTAEGPGTLSAPSCFLSNVASGSPLSQCTVDYTPSGVGDGVHTISADYPGPLFGVYLPSSGSVDLPLVTDTDAPITTAQVVAGTAGTPPWYRSMSVTVRLSATDEGGSGVDSIAYRIDGGPTVVVEGDSTDVAITGNALHVVEFSATDGAGNVEATQSFTVGIDTVAPTLTVTGVADGATYTVGSVPAAGCTANDNLAAAGSLPGSPTLAVTPLPADALGAHTARCSVSDLAGNEGSASAGYTVVAAPRLDEVAVRFTGAYTFAASGTVTSGNIVEGTRTLAGTVTIPPGTTVAIDCTNVRPLLGIANCVVRVTAPPLGSAPVVTSGIAAYTRTTLTGGRVRHELVMVGLRPVRVGPILLPLPYRLQVTVVDAG